MDEMDKEGVGKGEKDIQTERWRERETDIETEREIQI